MGKKHTAVVSGILSFYITIGIISDSLIAIIMGIYMHNFWVFLGVLIAIALYYVVLYLPFLAIVHLVEAIEDSAIFLAQQNAELMQKYSSPPPPPIPSPVPVGKRTRSSVYDKVPGKICPVCQHVNPANVYSCEECGMGL